MQAGPTTDEQHANTPAGRLSALLSPALTRRTSRDDHWTGTPRRPLPRPSVRPQPPVLAASQPLPCPRAWPDEHRLGAQPAPLPTDQPDLFVADAQTDLRSRLIALLRDEASAHGIHLWER